MNRPLPSAVEPVLPNTIEAEIALLGAVLVNNTVFDTVSRLVSADDFSDGLNRKIWEIIQQHRAEGRICNPITLKAVLGDAPIGEISVGKYLARLVSEHVGIAYVRDYARVVREGAQRRCILTLAQEMVSLATSGTSIRDIALSGITSLDSIAAATSVTAMPRVTIGKAAARAIEQMRAAQARGGRIVGITTGFLDLDAATGGWEPGTLIIGAGRPGMGKSMMAEAIGVNAAKAGHGTALFTPEMTDIQIGQRALSEYGYDPASPIPYHNIYLGQVSDLDAHHLEQTQRRLDRLPLHIEQEPTPSVAQIAARTRVIKAELESQGRTLDLIIVDHLHEVRPAKRRQSQHEEITEICQDLKALAKTFNVPVVCFCQLNRGTEGRDDKRPNLSDLRGSGSIEQIADLVFFLYRAAYYLDRQSFKDQDREDDRLAALTECQHKLEVIIAKQRQGPLKTIVLFCSIACNVLRDLKS